MKDSVKNNAPLPRQLLTQLTEHTRSYFLFFIDGNGEPLIIGECDDTTHSLALHKYIQDYLNAVEDLNSREMLRAITPEEDCE